MTDESRVVIQLILHPNTMGYTLRDQTDLISVRYRNYYANIVSMFHLLWTISVFVGWHQLWVRQQKYGCDCYNLKEEQADPHSPQKCVSGLVVARRNQPRSQYSCDEREYEASRIDSCSPQERDEGSSSDLQQPNHHSFFMHIEELLND